MDLQQTQEAQRHCQDNVRRKQKPGYDKRLTKRAMQQTEQEVGATGMGKVRPEKMDIKSSFGQKYFYDLCLLGFIGAQKQLKKT